MPIPPTQVILDQDGRLTLKPKKAKQVIESPTPQDHSPSKSTDDLEFTVPPVVNRYGEEGAPPGEIAVALGIETKNLSRVFAPMIKTV